LWKKEHDFPAAAREVEDDARRQLDKLSRMPQPWVRAYVAAILPMHPQFRSAELVDRLKQDSAPVVVRLLSYR